MTGVVSFLDLLGLVWGGRSWMQPFVDTMARRLGGSQVQSSNLDF